MRLDSLRGALRLERSVFRARGRIGMRQSLVVTGHAERILVTGEAWLLSTGCVEYGAATISGRDARAFTMFLPAHSLVRVRLDDVRFSFTGVAGFGTPPYAHASPVLLDPRYLPDAAPLLHDLDPDAGVEPALRAARRTLHDALASPRPVAIAADAVDMPSYALCRAFAAAYGITPKQYVHRARVFDATLRLLGGAAVIEAALASGFADLGRFYTQFRRIVRSTPARYRPARTAKTRRPRTATEG
jgi:AraC-like DNA-binding protein